MGKRSKDVPAEYKNSKGYVEKFDPNNDEIVANYEFCNYFENACAEIIQKTWR